MTREKEEYSLRELIRIEMSDVKTSLAKIETHNEYTKATLDEHKVDIGRLKATNQRQKGAIWVLTTLGIGSIVGFLKHIFS